MVILPDPDVRSTMNVDGAVLLNIRTGVIFKMNPVGAQIWKQIEQGCSLEQILSSLTEAYKLPREQIEEDARNFFRQLKAKGLISERELESKT